VSPSGGTLASALVVASPLAGPAPSDGSVPLPGWSELVVGAPLSVAPLSPCRGPQAPLTTRPKPAAKTAAMHDNVHEGWRPPRG
jgi:hypothetical protein